MGIPYSEEIKILDVDMRNTLKQWALTSWTTLASLVRTQARGAYIRGLNITQRITYAQFYMLTNLRHTAQCYRLPSECLRQIISAIASYIWQGAIFRVLLSTLWRQKEDGCWGLIEVNIKCRALMITRILPQIGKEHGLSKMSAGPRRQ